MSAAPARNWAAMLKEKKAVAPQAAPAKPVVVAPIDAPVKAAEPTPAAAAAPEAPLAVAVPAELVKAESVATPTAVEAVLSPVSVATLTEVPAPAQVSLGPVSLSEALAKLVKENDFRFAGAVAPRAPPTPIVVAADPPTVATPPAPIATAPTVTSSSELRGNPQWTTQPHHHHHQQQHHQQSAYNPPVHYFVPPQSTARPYGGELGSVPRFFNAERHFNAEQHHQAQPYHPTYQTPYHTYRGGYGGQAYNNNPYDNTYPSYYPGQGTPYMGGRLQAQQPYYPPRNYQQQQQ